MKKIAIIGRPNVGKSTLFNKLFGRRRALVHDMPGVTRDRLEEPVEWKLPGDRIYRFKLVDTGGIGGETLDEEITRQVKTALQEADLALVLFDGRAGLTPHDEEVLRQIKRWELDRNLSLIGVVNKIDTDKDEERVGEFYAAGLTPLLSIAAEHSRGLDELKEAITLHLEPEAPAKEEEEPSEKNEFESRVPRVAIVGRPNVGKSTLLNALLREERVITSPMAGTTVDSVDVDVELGGRRFTFIDTAGVRRRSKTEQGVEVLSVIQTQKALDRADIAILVIDGEEGPTDQDRKIGGMIAESGCSVVMAVNKWDVLEKRGYPRKEAVKWIQKEMAYLMFAPVLFISAKEGTGLDDLGELLWDVLDQRQTRIPTHEFSDFVRAVVERLSQENARVYFCHQAGKRPVTFVCHVNDPDKVHFSLRRHIVNGIRERWGFMGTPIRLKFLKSRSSKAAG